MTTWQHYKAGDKREGGAPMTRRRNLIAGSDEAIYLENLGTGARYAIELHGVPKRPDPSKLLASVHPKVAKRKRSAPMTEPSQAKQHVLKIADPSPTQALRAEVYRWWEQRLHGEVEVSMPALAQEAFDHFSRRDDCVNGFFGAFGYDVLYDVGINLISSWRRGLPDKGEPEHENLPAWFERGPDCHVRLDVMSAADLEVAIERRERLITLDRLRVEALRAIYEGADPLTIQVTTSRSRSGREMALVVDGDEYEVAELDPITFPDFVVSPDDLYSDDGFAGNRYQATEYGPAADPEGKGEFWEDYGVSMGGGPELLLRCPVCSDNYNHHDSPIEYRRAREDGVSVATCRGEPVTPRHPNPSSRRNGIAIPMWCEQGHHWTLFISQHKGFTFVHATASPPLAGE